MTKRGHRKPRVVVGDVSDRRSMAAKMIEFMEWLRTRNFSEVTVQTHDARLRIFFCWCEERGIRWASEVTKPILERYQRHLYYYRAANGRVLGFRSQYSYLVSVRAFFKWLTRYNHILYNPASDLQMPKVAQRLPRTVLSMGEMERVLAQASLADPLGIRDRAILETLYSTGMRRMELASLLVIDLDLTREVVLIRQGKGKKDRVVPVGERALMYIEKYLREVRPGLVMEPDEYYLFLTNTGESMTLNWLTQMAKHYVDKAGLSKSGACHLFRHTCATLMLENGADIRYIQELLGHSDLSTTQVYTQVSIKQLKDVHTATHPARFQREGQGARLEDTEAAALLSALDAEAEDEEEEDVLDES